MNNPVVGPSRRVTVALAAAVALLSMIVVLASSGAGEGHAADGHGHATAPRGTSTAKQAAFQDAMRNLWEQHVTWTRLAIVSFASGNPDLPMTEERLLRNQTDIGNAVKPFYGRAAGDRLTSCSRSTSPERSPCCRRPRPATTPRSRAPRPPGTPTGRRSPTS